MEYRALRRSVVSLAVLTATLAGGSAQAQQVEADRNVLSGQRPAPVSVAPFEEIIVTARRREEILQTVPISVSAFSGSDLERRNVQSIADLRLVTPSVTVQPDTFRQDTINVTIRGLRNFPSNGIQFDTAAAVYVNGVYIARTQGLTGALFDVDSVQVLKGPQGTLVGRNATGGAILYTNKEPQREFGGNVMVTAGDYGKRAVQAVLNLPISDKILTRAALSYDIMDGYLKNLYFDPATNTRNDTPSLGHRKTAGLFSVKLLPDDDTKILLRGSFDTEHHTGTAYHSLYLFEGTNPSTGPIGNSTSHVSRPSICNIPTTCNQYTDLDGRVIAPYYSDVAARTVNADPRAYNSLIASLLRQQADFWSVDQALNAPNAGHFRQVSGEIDREVGGVSVKLLGGYRWTSTEGFVAARGATFNNINSVYVDPDYDALTAELTLNGKAIDDRLDWTAGLFYFRESAEGQGAIAQFSSSTPSFLQPTPGRQGTITDTSGTTGANRSYAGYAQATYKLLDDLRLTGGVRYTRDERKAHITGLVQTFPATSARLPNSTFTNAPITVNGITYNGYMTSCRLTEGNATPRRIDACAFDVKRNFSDPTWTLALDHTLFANTLIYATTRRGYKAGAINSGATNAAVTVAEPEKVQDYEIGIKSGFSLGAMPVRANLAGFFTDYKNIQVQVALPYVVNAAGPGGGPCTQAAFNVGQCTGTTTENVTLNARSAEIFGAEWELSARPIPQLTLSWNGSYLHPKYTNFTFSPPAGYLRPATGGDLTGQPFPLPAWNMSGAATYRVTGGEIGLPVGSAALTASIFYQGEYRTRMTGYHPLQKAQAYALTTMRLDFEDILTTRLDLAATVSNVLNRKACFAEPGGASGGAGVLGSTPNATFGVAGTSGIVQCVPVAPRMFAVSLRYTF